MTKPDPYDAIIASPLGPLGLRIDGDSLVEIDYLPPGTRRRAAGNAAARRVVAALARYFQQGDAGLPLPVRPRGTAFQQRVWRAMQQIPPGRTRTYGQLAARLGSGARAVGNACRANPVPIVIPCHRVVAANGVGGYGGAMAGAVLDRKRWLLAHEGAEI